MADACPNIVVCPCSTVFQSGPPGMLAASLDGLLWQLPINDTSSPPWAWPSASGGCATPPDVISGLSGSPGRIYNVTLLFRGICEPATYTIGAPPAGSLVGGTGGLMSLGGSYVNDGHNIYSLIISDPPAIYFLNNWDGTGAYGNARVIRYTATVQVRTGATVALHADPVNLGEATNYPPQVVTVLGGEPPLQFTQPPYNGPGGVWPGGVYDNFGQVLQMSVISIT